MGFRCPYGRGNFEEKRGVPMKSIGTLPALYPCHNSIFSNDKVMKNESVSNNKKLLNYSTIYTE